MQFQYDGVLYVCEPYCCYKDVYNRYWLFGYQVGASEHQTHNAGWQRYLLRSVSRLGITDDRFLPRRNYQLPDRKSIVMVCEIGFKD